MLAHLERLSNRVPPRLKALLNLAITVALVLLCVPFLWSGLGGAWADLSFGLGLLLLGLLNLLT